MASARLGIPVEQLYVSQGSIKARENPSKVVSYGELLGGQSFSKELTDKIKPKSPNNYKIVGSPIFRVDIPPKITGEHPYMQNLRLPGMLHGRVVRPSAVGAKLLSVDESSIKDIAGVVKVITKDNFVGVICERENQAIQAARSLKVPWQDALPLPAMSDLYSVLRKIPSTF